MRIFIGYRREDAAGHAGRLFDRLTERFGRDQVFRDIDTLAAGDDFVEAVQQKVRGCELLLVLIGPRWLTATDAEGRWRLADEQDLVRVEIGTALARGTRVIPVLLQGAAMPKAKDLPGAIAALANRNAVQIRDSHFDHDVDQLVEAIGPAWRQRAARWLLRWPAYTAAAALALALAGWLYPKVALTPERARVQISALGLAFTPDSFVRLADRNDALAVGLFLKAGMAPDAKDGDGRSATDVAIYRGHRALVDALLDAGASVDGALTAAASIGDARWTGLLLGRAPSRPGIDEAVVVAAGAGHTDIVRALLDKGGNPNAARRGQTALAAAAAGARPEAVRLLIARGADVRAKTKGGLTPLHEALDHRSDRDSDVVEVVRQLLDKGAPLNERAAISDSWQPTPLLLAIENSLPRTARLLIERGADVTVQTGANGGPPRTVTALMLAAYNRLDDTVQALLAKGIDVNARNDRDESALLFAFETTGDPASTVRLLLAAGADQAPDGREGRTPLIRASMGSDNADAVRALLAAGAAVDLADRQGGTALLYAAARGDRDIVRLLLDGGADRSARTADGETALALAEKYGHPNTAKVLRDAGAASGATARPRTAARASAATVGRR